MYGGKECRRASVDVVPLFVKGNVIIFFSHFSTSFRNKLLTFQVRTFKINETFRDAIVGHAHIQKESET